MVQVGVVAAVTISVLLMRRLLIVLCLRRRAPTADVCGFLKPSGCQRFWKVNKHGASSSPRQVLGLRANGQSCHHETWLQLQFVDWSNRWDHQAHYDGNIRLWKSKTSYPRGYERPLALIMSAQPLALPGSALFFAHHHEVT